MASNAPRLDFTYEHFWMRSRAAGITIPVLMAQYRQRGSMRFLRTNTATRITVGPFLDKTDGVTPEVALTVTACKLTLMVDTGGVPTLVLDTNPTASGGANDMVHVTGDDAGYYDLELAAADVNYLGRAALALTDAATHCPVFHEFMILPANVYDSLVSGSGVGVRADVQGWLGTAPATPAVAGYPKTDALAAGTSDSGSLTTMVDSARTEADVDYWRDATILFTSGTIAGQARRITGFLPSADRITFWPPTTAAVTTQTYEILPHPPVSRRTMLSYVDYHQPLLGLVAGETPYRMIVVKDKIFAVGHLTASANGKLIRFNSPRTDLSDTDVINYANDGLHDSAYRLAYSEATGKVYVAFFGASNRLIVSEVNPDTLAATDLIDDSSVESNGSWGGGCVAFGAHLYVLTSHGTSSNLLKYNLPGGTLATKLVLTSLPSGNGLCHDGESLFAVGHSASGSWIAKVNASAMTFTSQTTSDSNRQGGVDPIMVGSDVWVGHSSGSLAGQISSFKSRDITSETIIDTGKRDLVLGLSLVNGNVVVTHNAAQGLVVIDPHSYECTYHPPPHNGTGVAEAIAYDGQFFYVVGDDADNDVYITRGVLSGGGEDLPRAAATGVWGAQRADHTKVGSFGQAVQARFMGAVASATASTLVLGTEVYGAAASALDDEYNGLIVLVIAGTGEGQQRTISDYVGSSKTITPNGNWTTTPDNTSKVVILGV